MGFPLSVAHIWSRSETLVIVAFANEISDQGKVGAVLAKWWLVVPMIWSLATDRPTDRPTIPNSLSRESTNANVLPVASHAEKE